jgi:hypothetical protein
MKLRFLHLVLLACLLTGLPVMSRSSYSQSQETITESEIMGILNAIDRASRKGNVAGIIAPLAQDVKIKMRVSTPGSASEKLLTLSKDQYASNIRQVFRKRLAYQLERKNTRVKIYDDHKTAMVTSDIYETLTVRQGTLRAASSEVSILSLRNGKVVVTSIEARTRFY